LSKETERPVTPEGSLVALKLKIMAALKVDSYVLKHLIDQFVTKTFHSTGNSKTHFAKVNIYNELTNPTMTIKVFFKFLRIMRFKKVTITVKAVRVDDKVVEVSQDFNIFQEAKDDE